jgi:hypothetical protein
MILEQAKCGFGESVMPPRPACYGVDSMGSTRFSKATDKPLPSISICLIRWARQIRAHSDAA